MAVLQRLEKEKHPISLPDLLHKLGRSYSERSLRRWLAQMVQEGLIEKFGEHRGTKYQIVLPTASAPALPMSPFGTESLAILHHVQRPIHERRPVAYADDWLDSYKPNTTFYIPHFLRSQLSACGKRSKQEEPAGTYAHHIFNRLLIELSYNSSRLEGNTYSLLDTQKLLLEGSAPEGKLEEEKVMILNHKEAIRYLVDHAATLEINDATVCQLHYLLSDGLVEPKYAGKLRDYGVRIGGSTYVPFENIKHLHVRLIRITAKAALIKDFYEQSLFLLAHLTYLQAFADVNKRVARLSSNIPLIKNNLVPLSFNDIEKENYISAMIAIYELQDIRPLVDLYVFSYMRSCSMYDSTVQAMGFDEIRVRYRYQRRTLLREIILKKHTGKSLVDYISSQLPMLIPPQDQTSVHEDLLEDLREMDANRIVGLGVTLEEFNLWKQEYYHSVS